MKLLFRSITIFAVLLLSANAWAIPIDIDDEVTMSAWAPIDDHYTLTDITKGGTTYHTFCVQSEVNYTPGRTYYVQSVGDTVQFDDKLLSDAAKWLYATYFDGGFGAHTDILETQVQNAIWWAQNQPAGVENDFLSLVGSETEFEVTGWDIQVVNLTTTIGGTTDVQSQLVGVAPVPEPATMLLLGTGLVGLAGFSRKRLKK